MSRPTPPELLIDFPEPDPVDPQIELDRVAALYRAAAVDFVASIRWAAGFAWAIRPGKSDVRVSAGKRVPHGLYRVTFVTSADRIEITALPVRKNATRFRVNASEVEPQPLWHESLTECGWTAWHATGVAAGIAENGFDRFVVCVLADCIAEYGVEGIPFFDGLDLDPYRFSEVLRESTIDPQNWILFTPVVRSRSFDTVSNCATPYPRHFNCRCSAVPLPVPESEDAR